jgi:hypothetical protein
LVPEEDVDLTGDTVQGLLASKPCGGWFMRPIIAEAFDIPAGEL